MLGQLPCFTAVGSGLQVRDRATLHLEQLEGKAGGPDAVQPRLDVNLVAMEKALADYLAVGTDKPFDIVSGAAAAEDRFGDGVMARAM